MEPCHPTILVQVKVYADDIVIIGDSAENMQQKIVECRAELGRKGMLICTDKSKIMQIG